MLSQSSNWQGHIWQPHLERFLQIMDFDSRYAVPYPRSLDTLGVPPLTSGRRLRSFGAIDAESLFTSVAGRSHNHHEQSRHLPAFLAGSEDSSNRLLLRILPSDESPSPPDLSPWTDSASVSPMEDLPQQNHDAAVRATPYLSSVGNNDLPTSYPFNDIQMSSTSTSSAQRSHPGSYFTPPNMIPPPNDRDQNNPARCAFDPIQISYYPLHYGQAQLQPQRQESFPTQRTRDDSTASAPFDYQRPSSTEQPHRYQDHGLSSNLLESPNWSTASNLGSGRSLSVSQLEGTESGGSEHTSSSYARSHYNPQSYRPYPEEHAELEADDEGSDTMSDGIASDEGVYSSSVSDRDVFDDDGDFGSFEVDSDEEYGFDEYSDN